MPKDPLDILDDDLTTEEGLDDLDVPMDINVVYIDKSKEPTKIVKAAESADKHVNEFKDKLIHCEHTWFKTRAGYDRCPKCSSGRMTLKQKNYLYALWTRRFGVMTKTAADFIDNFSIDDASAIIDRLRRR